jgi:integrase/recombinase XerD
MEIVSDSQSTKMFKNDCRIRGLSKHTIESYISSLNLFSKFLKKKKYNLMTVDRKILREYISYLREKGISQKTIENRFSALSSLYDYLVYENILEKNIIKEIRKRYLSPYKENGGSHRKLISVEEMSCFINSILDIRDKAISILFAKTGIRRRELVAIDLEDVNWDQMSITLKPTHKRSNKIVYFDFETAFVLKQWLRKREIIADHGNKALFISYINKKKRLNRNGVGYTFVKWAIITGLHNSNSNKIEDHFTPHCCRHWFTTHLRRAGMPREFIMELRGDKRNSAMDIYYHIDREDLRKSYLACIPKLGV